MNTSATYQQFHTFQKDREEQWSPKINYSLHIQVKQFVNAYNKGASETEALMSITSGNIYRISKAIRIDGATIFGAKVAAYLPKKPVKTKSRPTMGFNGRMIDLINLYFDSEILNTSEGITDTTRKEIRHYLKLANEDGRGISWVAEQLDNLSKSRAKLIARTETVTGANMGGFIAALDTGLMMQKEWLSVNDTKTRPDHVHVNGRTVNLTDYFHAGDSTLLYPGDRTQQNGLETPAAEVCNCRCTTLYKPVRVDGRLVPFDYSMFRNLLV